jgi:predicted RNA-binding protein YlxR (DUF448 family)
LQALPGKRRPMRKCLACGCRKHKAELLRFVISQGRLSWDEKKQMPGRGYYLCQNIKCLGLLAETKKVTRAFRLADCEEDAAGLLSLILERIQGASDGQNAGL